jgi:hypothetical protein
VVKEDLRPTLVYCRESRDENSINYQRIEVQRDILLAFCHRRGLTNIVDVIMDDDCTGTDFRRFDEIVRRVARKEIQVIVFKDASRLGRNLKESLIFRDFMAEQGAELLFESGADVLTGGNHSFRRYAIFDLLEDEECVLRPLNFPPSSPGNGYCIVPVKNGLRALVISVCGQVFMDPVDSPFYAVERVLEAQKGKYDIAICDFHGEATSEKQAFMHHFDGRLQIVFGTHTHVQTADERLTSRGSGYISDIGMCGSE